MVLRFFLFLILLIAQNSFAKESKNSISERAYRKSMQLHNKKKYKRSNAYLDKYVKPLEIKVGLKVYMLHGLNLERLGQFDKAGKSYLYGIKWYFKKEYKLHLKNLRSNGLEDFDEEVGDEIAAIYYRMGHSYLESSELRHKSDKKYSKRFRKAKIFLTLASNADGDISDLADEQLERMDKLNQYAVQSRKKIRYGFTLGRMLWTDEYTLKDIVNDKESQVYANSQAVSIGIDIRYSSAISFYRINTGLFSGTSVVGEKNNYFIENASILGAFFIPSMHYVSPFKQASLGVSLPVYLRNSNVTDTETKAINEKSQVATGVGIESNWEYKGFNLGMAFELLSGIESSMFHIDIGYIF